MKKSLIRILADASLPGLDQAFPKPFELSFYKQAEEIQSLLPGQQILICRASLKVNEALLAGSALDCVATASSGTDHINPQDLRKHAIELIDAKGSNARAVADYVVASLAYLQKAQGFSAKKAGVIGLGEVGSRVAKRLAAAQMEVLTYDPPRSLVDLNFRSCSLEDLTHCDLLTVHANLHDNSPYPSRDLLNADFLSQLKPRVVIINASRGGIVDEEALLGQSKRIIYCTDVYEGEPSVNKELVDFASLCTPHIAGHSIEAKHRAIVMLSEKLHSYYHLAPPNSIFPELKKRLPFEPKPSWQETALSLYNPAEETAFLKAADDLKSTFLTLRKAHLNRHDFCVYDETFMDEQTRRIIGFLGD